MPYSSHFAGKCKDCGKTYAEGDEIDTNGNSSPNKMGEMKDHWCPDGKNCQGAMQTTDTIKTDLTTTTTGTPNTETSPEKLLELARELLKERGANLNIDSVYAEAYLSATRMLIEKAAIDTVMDKAGIKHPSRVAFTHSVQEDLRA